MILVKEYQYIHTDTHEHEHEQELKNAKIISVKNAKISIKHAKK